MSNKTKINTELANSVMEKINQGLGDESSELIEGRKDKRNVRDKSNVNVNLLVEIQICRTPTLFSMLF